MSCDSAPWRDASVDAIAALAREFMAAEVTAHWQTWESQHFVDRSVWSKAGELGLIGCSLPERHGGGEGTIAHEIAVAEEQGRAGDASWGYVVHSIAMHYIHAYGTEAQKTRWLPPLARGQRIAAIAMSEPGAGSDLQGTRTKAVRQADGSYLVDGAKTFISNGFMADVLMLVAKTDPAEGAKGVSLFIVDTDTTGLSRGRVLEKLGQHGADTCELFFDHMTVPAECLLGEVEGQGFRQLMEQLPEERLLIAAGAVGGMAVALEQTVAYVKQRQAFGKAIWDFQNTQFVLAECATSVRIARAFFDSCVDLHLRSRLDSATAAMLKWWITDQYVSVLDHCVQLHGGYGYMREYPVARMYQDARAQRIYGGSNEIMKVIIARSL